MIPVKNRSEIITEAASWGGTPWHHMQASKGAGVDCVGIVRGVYAFTYGLPVPPCEFYYHPSWFYPPITRSLLDEALVNYLYTKSSASMEPGDIFTFDRYRAGIATHCGIILDDAEFIHVDSRKGAVVTPFETPWKNRIVSCFSFFPTEV